MKLSKKITAAAFSMLLLVGCSSHGNSAKPQITNTKTDLSSGSYQRYLKSDYDIAFNLPKNWNLTSVRVHPNGFAKFYEPKSQKEKAQSVVVHYFKDEKATPEQFVARAKEVTAKLNCKVDEAHVKTMQKNSVTFTVINKQCASIHDLIQVYKVFEMPDGLYTISYKAKIKTTSATDVAQMSRIVENAKIVKR